MEARDVLFGLHEMPGIGWHTVEAVVNNVPDLTELTEWTLDDIRRLPLVPGKAELVYQACRQAFIEGRKQLYEEGGYGCITILDEHYPHYLREIGMHPWVIYYAGNRQLLEQPVLAVVGTRTPTAYGKRVARQLSQEMSELGWRIASGMARGIDSEAHIGALEGPGKTIAVLGSPLNVVYPPENRRLYERIREEGLIVSEYPLGTIVRKGLFHLRNRIISGISLGVLVVEAAEKSGSLITSKYASEQNREIFAVPGPISSPKSAGTNDLLRDSARIVCEVEDILNAFRHTTYGYDKPPVVFADIDSDGDALTDDERRTLSLLSDIPMTFDQLYERTQFDFGHLHAVLISLLMKKKIIQQAGTSYILSY